MKIGIITFHRTVNFGSYLQTFGLYQKIKDLGYDCEIIDYRCEAIETREHLNRDKINFKIKQDVKNFLKYLITNKKFKRLMSFLINNTKISPVYTKDTICISEKRYDKIIVGSDIVWGRDITNFDYTYFLDFVADGTKKYSYASSVGYCDEPEDKDILKQLLQDFEMITVREEDAVDWVSGIAEKEAQLVCDPTMLLTADEWESFIEPKKYQGRYVLVYFTDDKGKCMDDAIAYAREHDAQVWFINFGRNKKGVKNVRPHTINEFLGLIKYSDMIFTASYHGMLYSLYYNKEFLFYTRTQKSRVLSLANKMEVQAHCGDELSIEDYTPVDYKRVNELLSAFRIESSKLLQYMLERKTSYD